MALGLPIIIGVGVSGPNAPQSAIIELPNILGAVCVVIASDGGPFTVTISDADTGRVIHTRAAIANIFNYFVFLGVDGQVAIWCSTTAGITNSDPVSLPLPRRLQLDIGAAGVGIITSFRVLAEKV